MFSFTFAFGFSASAILYGLLLVIYRLCFSLLPKFPGPKLAAATYWYEFYYDVWLWGQYTFKIIELHKKYGPSEFPLCSYLVLKESPKPPAQPTDQPHSLSHNPPSHPHQPLRAARLRPGLHRRGLRRRLTQARPLRLVHPAVRALAVPPLHAGARPAPAAAVRAGALLQPAAHPRAAGAPDPRQGRAARGPAGGARGRRSSESGLRGGGGGGVGRGGALECCVCGFC